MSHAVGQLSALQDLLTIHLSKVTQREVLHSKDHVPQYLTGFTTCRPLVSGALQTDYWVLLAVIALITGSVLHVLVLGDSRSSTSDSHRTSEAKQSSNRQGSKHSESSSVIVNFNGGKV